MKEKLAAFWAVIVEKAKALWAAFIVWWNSETLARRTVILPLKYVIVACFAIFVVSAAMLIGNRITKALSPADAIVTLADVKPQCAAPLALPVALPVAKSAAKPKSAKQASKKATAKKLD